MGETFYDVLGVDPDATGDEITEAYRERVLETHPDRNDDPDATERFKRVTAAEEVLGDPDERARYDRLGHDSYVRLESGFRTESADPGSDGGGATGTDAAGDGAAADASSRERAGSTGGGFVGSASAASGTGNASTASGTRWNADRGPNGGGPSHHARQRRRRRRATAAADWWVNDDESTAGSAADGVETESGAAAGADGEEGFSYSVHDWDDEIEVERESTPLDQGTIVVVACVTLLYPVFVYASVGSAFPLPVNAIVAACTLVLVGYLLTMPKIAMGAFGLWSAVVPIALPSVTDVDPLSVPGLLAIAAFWVPFGYAVAVRAALRS